MATNTLFIYQYRDASNYKEWKEVIIKGKLSYEDIERYLKDCEFFVPSVVGLQDLQGIIFTANDHIWHEILSIETTSEPNTIDLDAETLKLAFKTAWDSEWNESEVFKSKGLV